ncbi:hypothetical protein [Paeniglutamicibacter sp.]|uniref:hypothetical protein n=1 Tax=Paeniglutamicibacter sp. TaxID=1934391 RepID=UPI0039893FAA
MTEHSNSSKAIRDHLPLAASLLLVVVAALRVFYFSGPDVATALAITSVIDYPAILLASLTTLLAPALPIALFFYPPLGNWMMAGTARNATSSERWRSAIVWTPLAILYSWAFTPGMLLALLFLFLYQIGDSRKAAWSRIPKLSKLKYVGHFIWHMLPAFAVFLVVFPLLFRPWTPLESIEMKAKQETTIGYVIGEQSGKMLVIDSEKIPVWIESDQISTRSICAEEPNWISRPLFQNKSKIPEC